MEKQTTKIKAKNTGPGASTSQPAKLEKQSDKNMSSKVSGWASIFNKPPTRRSGIKTEVQKQGTWAQNADTQPRKSDKTSGSESNGLHSNPDTFFRVSLFNRLWDAIKKYAGRRYRTVRHCLRDKGRYLLYLGCVWFGCIALWQMMYGGIGPGKWILMVVSAGCKRVPGEELKIGRAIIRDNFVRDLTRSWIFLV